MCDAIGRERVRGVAWRLCLEFRCPVDTVEQMLLLNACAVLCVQVCSALVYSNCSSAE